MPLYKLVFFGNNGDFAYEYGRSEHIEWLFRNPRLNGMEWEFDGDGWSTTGNSEFVEAKQIGRWYITRA